VNLCRRLRPVAVLATVALIGAGCSSEPADNGSAANPNGAARGKGVRFAQCMRDHGVAAFPDPDASGELTIDGVLNGSSLDPDAPAWKAAMSACQDLQPAGFTGDHDVSSAEQKMRLRFAACIRRHGVTDFPDPVAGAPLVDTNQIPSSAQPGGMSALNAAMHACADLGPQAAGR
jgi:hypothetical protein